MTRLSLYLTVFACRLDGWKSLGETKDFIIYTLQTLLVLVCFSGYLDLVAWMWGYTCKDVLWHWVATKPYNVLVCLDCLDFYFYLWVCLHDWIFACIHMCKYPWRPDTRRQFFLSFFSDTGVTDGCKLTILDAGSIIWVLCKIHKSS